MHQPNRRNVTRKPRRPPTNFTAGVECWHCGRRHDHPIGAVGCCLFAPDEHLKYRVRESGEKKYNNIGRRPTVCLSCGGPSKRTFCQIPCAESFHRNALDRIEMKRNHRHGPLQRQVLKAPA